MSDAAPAIFNGFSKCYPDILPGKYFFHMLKKMKDRSYDDEDVKNKLLSDISILAKSSSQKLFDCSLDLFLKKYKLHSDVSIVRNVTYFEDYWLQGRNIGWHSGLMPGTVTSNNGLEVTNRIFKNNFHGTYGQSILSVDFFINQTIKRTNNPDLIHYPSFFVSS